MQSLLLALTLAGLPNNFLDREITDIYQDEQLQLTLVSERNAMQAGEGNWLGLYFEMADGWHIYWQNPGDNGAPPEVSWSLPDGVSFGDISWPVPEKFYLDSFVDYGYHSALLMLPFTVSSGHSSVLVEAQVDWLACKDICLPGNASLQLELPVLTETEDSFQAPLFKQARELLPRPVTDKNARFIRRDDEVVVMAGALSPEDDALVYPLTRDLVRYDQSPVIVVDSPGVEIRFKADPHLTELPEYFDFVVAYPDRQPVQIRALLHRGH